MPHEKSSPNLIIASCKNPHEIEIELATFIKEGGSQDGIKYAREETRGKSFSSFKENLVHL